MNAAPASSATRAARTRELPVGAVAPTLADLDRALCRDRSHVVVAARPSPERALLARALPGRVAGRLRVARLALAPVSEPELARALLDALGQDPTPDGHPAPDAEARVLEISRELEQRGSALLLLIEDAEALSEPQLARLGRLARASLGVRLALFAGPEGEDDAGFFARLVAGLGVGAQKIELPTLPGRAGAPGQERGARQDRGARKRQAKPPERRSAASAPAPRSDSQPAVRDEPARSPRLERVDPAARREDISVVGPRSSRAAGAAWPLALALLAVVGLALWALGPRGPGASEPAETAVVVAVRRPAAMLVEPPEPPPLALAPKLASPVSLELPLRAADAPGREPVESPPALPVEPLGGDVQNPDPAEAVPPAEPAAPAAAPVARATEPPPKPPVTVQVSINASPWARIEVDGRDIGVTPLGSVRLSAGPHRFRAHLPDGSVVERTVEVGAYRNHIAFP